MAQLSCYINTHAEELCSYFVAHGEKNNPEVDGIGSIGTVNSGAFAERLAARISDNVVDPELPSWFLLFFSTPTDSDSVMRAVLFMGATQSYFSYNFILAFGFPTFTLLGELSDWKDIRNRLDNQILTLSEELQKFRLMRVPILDNFILSFEQLQSIPVKEFWDAIATIKPRGSGADSLLGWITAFCYWDKEGVAKNNVEIKCQAWGMFPIPR